jgi:hypothetical protein
MVSRGEQTGFGRSARRVLNKMAPLPQRIPGAFAQVYRPVVKGDQRFATADFRRD